MDIEQTITCVKGIPYSSSGVNLKHRYNQWRQHFEAAMVKLQAIGLTRYEVLALLGPERFWPLDGVDPGVWPPASEDLLQIPSPPPPPGPPDND